MADTRSAATCRAVGIREAKILISQRLRDPNTDPKTFRDLLVILSRWSNWSKRAKGEPAETDSPDEVDDLVRKLESEKRTPSVENVVTMHEQQITGEAG